MTNNKFSVQAYGLLLQRRYSSLYKNIKANCYSPLHLLILNFHKPFLIIYKIIVSLIEIFLLIILIKSLNWIISLYYLLDYHLVLNIFPNSNSLILLIACRGLIFSMERLIIFCCFSPAPKNLLIERQLLPSLICIRNAD